MEKEIKIVLAFITLFYSHFALAESGWTDVVALAELVPTARHYYEFRLPVKNNPSGCTNKTWFYQNYGSHGSDKMFSTLLEAIKTGIRLRVYVTGVCNINGYAEISSISIIP